MYISEYYNYYTAITCPDLSGPANGQVTFATDTTVPYDFGTVATYTCGTGFGLSGDMTRTCGGDGSSTTGMWSATAPTCEGKQLMIMPFLITFFNTFNSYHVL